MCLKLFIFLREQGCRFLHRHIPAFGWSDPLPNGVSKTDSGLLITAGAAKSELKLELTNEAHTTDIVFRLVNKSGIPMAGEKVKIFTSDQIGRAHV